LGWNNNHTLASIRSSPKNSGKDAIICTIDLASNPDENIRRVLGIDENVKITSAVNYQKLSLDSDVAIAYIKFDIKSYGLAEVLKIAKESNGDIVSTLGCVKLKCKKDEKFFETIVSHEVNQAIKNRKNTIILDCFEKEI